MDIPVVDFSTYDPASAGAIEALARQVKAALGETGFMTVINSGVDEAAISGVFARSSAFFRRDSAFKERFLYRDAGENFGYQGLGMESLEPGKPGDLKESFTLRLNKNAPFADERWPSAEFRDTVTAFYGECTAAANRMLHVMASAFALAPDYFSSTVGGENVALRLLRYPGGQAVEEGGEQYGAGAHTDYGILTLLFQRDVGGLEVQDQQGNWQAVPCVPGAVVINTGDLMEHWTNGRFRSTLHRVRPMTTSRERYSVAFFVDPDSATLVDALPACVDAANPLRYAPITAGEHIRRKLERTHNH
ncbi:isopenicillin N synthase family oxygenase [Parahaliea maris]|uniref:2-oxoglutarate-dependent ethylene/succinate-forming enzyme n=1 Tax=Parahaliea maris TaxID=2716870 RepID=A0A5C9A6D8_9GAMM|nr:2OG-Fe(II) oxygenase family protein [Parahaliea maris]TXS95330.1 isopenicillin N synthase family oxygenase [Parahaliea maris]